MRVVTTNHLPIKLWLDDLEEGAEQQARNLAALPFAFHHIAIMPDAHQGYGMPIGGVLATRDVIIPNAVGVDIGCGMIAQPIGIPLEDIQPRLKEIMGEIRKRVPVGFSRHEKEQDPALMPRFNQDAVAGVVEREYTSALKQIGTLGGGNHFIEIQRSGLDVVYIMIHSGSRNIGKQVADHYNKLAITLNERYKAAVPKEWELAFLPLDSDEGQQYLAEMRYCVEFAQASRQLMLERVLHAIGKVFNEPFDAGPFPPINIAHNYAAQENHFGQNVWVHRKGATLARQGTMGIIPGSQGTKSYIVQGLGNPESFMSCSHGAGRKLSRAKARNTLSLEGEIALLESQGVVHSIRNQKDLDEAAGAYKDINTVMANQTDLVEIVTELTPLAVIKG